MTPSQPNMKRRWPWHGWLGLTLVPIFWILNWTLSDIRTHWAFFPLWLGYCLSVDALVVLRKGSSLLTRSRFAYLGLFLASVPGWWLFELINKRTENWIYVGGDSISGLQYLLLSSLSFSTVMPAVFGTAELVGTWGWLRRLRRGPVVQPRPAILVGMLMTGVVMLALLLLWPRSCYPLVWLSVYFILEPLNAWLGRRTLLADTARGDWRPLLALWLGCLICGFFWEMWNFYSYPKWIYDVPFVDWLHIFEMPLLGYGGYLPFALELFALYHLLARPFGPATQSYLQLTEDQQRDP